MGSNIINLLGLLVFGFAVFGLIILDHNIRKKKNAEGE